MCVSISLSIFLICTEMEYIYIYMCKNVCCESKKRVKMYIKTSSFTNLS